MHRMMIQRSIFGLFLLAGSVVATRPANATLWRNYASSTNTFYLSMPNSTTQGQALYIYTYTGLVSQYFSLTADPGHPGYSTLVTSYRSSPLGPFMVVGVQNNVMSNGTPLIDWNPTGALNQDWRADYAFSDGNGAGCYVLYNANSPPSHVFVASVSGGVMSNNRPVIIYDYFSDPTNHPDQFWCRYKLDSMGNVVPE